MQPLKLEINNKNQKKHSSYLQTSIRASVAFKGQLSSLLMFH